MRLDKELIEKLARRAKEVGVGVSVLMRRYVETMLLYEELGLSKPVRLSVEEYGRLVKSIAAKENVEEYIEYLVGMFDLVTAWSFSDRKAVSLYELLAKLMELLKMEGKVTGYRVYSGGNKVGIAFEAVTTEVTGVLTKALAKFLAKAGKNLTKMKTVGRTAFIEVEEAG